MGRSLRNDVFRLCRPNVKGPSPRRLANESDESESIKRTSVNLPSAEIIGVALVVIIIVV